MIYYLIIEGRWLLTYLQTFFHTLDTVDRNPPPDSELSNNFKVSML